MAIIYPSLPAFRAIDLTMNDPTITFRAQSGKRISRKVSGNYFSFVLSYPPITLTDINPIRGAIAKARGQFQTFSVTPPNLATPLGTQTADTTIAVTAPIGSTSVDISGAGATNTFKAGDIIKFSNHLKVYMLTDDTVAIAGAATLSFVPPLLEEVVITSTTVKHSDVPFNVALANDLQRIKTRVDGYNSYELAVDEVF